MFRGKKKKKQILNQAFADLKRNLMENLSPEDKTLLFTASSEEVKKTSPVLNLGRSLVKDGKKVLLIDMNLRSPLLSKISKVELKEGFSAILVEGIPYENTITKDLYEKDLDLILSGRAMKNPDDFLQISTLRNLLGSLRERYDYILIDSPSNVAYPDANMISQSVDKVILFTNEKDKNKGLTNQALGKLEEMDAEILGLIETSVK
ncbi:MAG: CpsD/CapB family tyrosine-protein kinase [Anaerococcus sp.]|jgi:capsular exopolysaccharide synthesis family protein|nr:CpsD/CapB family tyrosine-protein kinase [Peptoniphilaceae bacterium]MDY3055708.1 CpsD/CapB family tyrosine-protein kinase [Anaerococcus sp.]